MEESFGRSARGSKQSLIDVPIEFTRITIPSGHAYVNYYSVQLSML